MAKFDGKVAIITGASRGIGREVALRLASEGAAITIAAKTMDPVEGLDGSLSETAHAIEQAGGRALPIQVDVRDEEQIRAMVERTASEFGRIDFLFNNAGAIFLRPVLETPVKRFDLMHQVNARASFIASHYALPHMVRQKWGHILMFSPALHTDPSPGMGAYMHSKLGMTRIALSIAAEHRADNVAANAIWPVTMIETAAVVKNNMGDPSQWRTPEIICDSVSELFSREPSECTGRELTDEDILREAGVTNFDHYWVEGKPPEQPILITGPGSVMR